MYLAQITFRKIKNIFRDYLAWSKQNKRITGDQREKLKRKKQTAKHD